MTVGITVATAIASKATNAIRPNIATVVAAYAGDRIRSRVGAVLVLTDETLGPHVHLRSIGISPPAAALGRQ